MWNRNLNPTELQAKNRLGLDKKAVIGFSEIYDFISRFAGVLEDEGRRYNWIDVKMSNGERIPPKTYDIISKIGSDRLFLYFSPMEYSRKFEGFCKKLMATKRVNYKDYVCPGVITLNPIEVEVTDYE